MAMPPPPPVSNARLEEGMRPGGPPPDEPVSAFVVCMNVTNTVTHLLLGAVAFISFIIANSINVDIGILSYSKFTAHIYLSVIGYVLLVSQAVISLNPRSGWGDNLKYPKKTKIYWGLQVLGSLLALIGGVLAIVAVGEHADTSISIPGIGNVQVGEGHLSSAHHIVGLVAMLLTAVSLVGGLTNLICTNLVNSSILKSLYSCVMTLSLIIAFVAICLGLNMHQNDNTTDPSINMGIAFTVLALVGMLGMLAGNLTVAGGKGIL